MIARLRTAALAVVVSGATAGLLSAVSYGIGLGIDPELQFLAPTHAPTIDEATVAQAMTYAIASREYSDVIFVGDSTCRMGVRPESFTKICGLSGWNLGSMRRIGPYGFWLTVAAYFRNHPAPKAVVVCVTPTLFESEPSTLDGEIQQRLTWVYGPEVASVWTNVPFVARRGAAHTLGFSDRDIRTEPLEGLIKESYFTLAAKSRKSRGFFALPGEHGPTNGIPLERPKILVRPEWDKGVRAIAKLCEAKGCRLLVVFGPLADVFAVSRDWSQLELWGESLRSAHPCATVVRPIFYGEAFMWDALHLNAAGVEKFMPLVAKDVEQALSRSSER
jgi:hypothetical protein